MQQQTAIQFCQERRDTIRQWLGDEAPFTEADQRHLDADTAERAYWHHGYQSALNDLIVWLDQNLARSGVRDPSQP